MPITAEDVARGVKKRSKTLHLRRNAARVMSHTRAAEALYSAILVMWNARFVTISKI
jgi:hypothetical protein